MVFSRKDLLDFPIFVSVYMKKSEDRFLCV